MTKFAKFNLDPISRQIASAKNKKFIKELQGEGMREGRIDQILREDYYRNIYSYPIFPRAKILECKKHCLNLSRSMGKITSLLRDKNIPDVISGSLQEEWKRLWFLRYDQEWIARLDSIKKYRGPGNPKTEKQMIGFQIRLLYKYLKPISETLNDTLIRQRDYRSQDVFELIRELLNVAGLANLVSWKQVKTMYGNAKRHKWSNFQIT